MNVNCYFNLLKPSDYFP